jgi:hypothetical protein
MKEEDYITQSFGLDGVRIDIAQTHCGMNPKQLSEPHGGVMTTNAFTRWYRINDGEWKGGMGIKLDEYGADILNAWIKLKKNEKK